MSKILSKQVFGAKKLPGMKRKFLGAEEMLVLKSLVKKIF